MPYRPAVRSYEDLRREAEKFLEEFHEERTLPVPIEEIVEFDFELEVIPIDGILDDLEVDAFLTSDLRHLYVDAFVMKHRHSRYRFSLAHEIGHCILHERLYLDSKIASVKDWERVQNAITEDAYAWFEFQANSFAGLVLVPGKELRDHFRTGIIAARKAGMPDSTIWSDAGKAYLVEWLGRRFDVSKDVIEKRLDKDDLWKLPPPP